MKKRNIEDLIGVALGSKPADIFIENGKILNVYSSEVLEGWNVAVKGDRIAYTGPDRKMAGQETRVIDARGLYLVPGYIDAHGHADLLSNPLALARAVLPLGTTAVLTDTHEMAGALGIAGIDLMLDITEGLPVKFYLALTAANPPHPAIEGEDSITGGDFRRYMEHSRVLAISEITPWKRLIDMDPVLTGKVCYASGLGKRVEGHGAGCSHERMNALVNAGITSCHESVSVEDVRSRLRLGLYTMIRHGSIRKELENVSGCFLSGETDTGRVLLTPDWMSPQDIVKHGYMDYVIKEAMRNGIPPLSAYRMATLNPAVYLGLDGYIGGIGPGRSADILFLEALEEPSPVMVMAGGEVLAEKGRLAKEIPGRCPSLGPGCWRAGRLFKNKAFPEELGQRASDIRSGRETVPALHIVNGTITAIKEIKLSVKDGFVRPEEGDVLKISMLSSQRGGFVTAFISGMGPFSGAMATSTAHEHHSPYVIGIEESDMALAFNSMVEMGGGHVLVRDGKVVAKCPLAVGGIMSDRDIPELARDILTFEEKLREMGCTLESPLVTLGFISFSGLPFARMTPRGLLDIKNNKIVFPL